MPSWLHLLLSVLLLSSSLEQQAPSGVLTDTKFYAASYVYTVAYVETMSSSTAKAITQLKQYRDANAKLDGFVNIEFFEQVGRPGHFVIVEAWRDQKAFDARNGAVQKQLLTDLQPIRVSDYDQRPYKAVTVVDGVGARRSSAMFVIAHVDVAPNPQVAVMLTQLAEASRKEAGNVRFDVLQHTMRANHFTVIEAWRDQKAFDAHVAATHTRQYRDALQPMTGSPLDERVYKAID